MCDCFKSGLTALVGDDDDIGCVTVLMRYVTASNRERGASDCFSVCVLGEGGCFKGK